MVAIFENRKIQQNDLDELYFPTGAILTNLPLEYRNLPSGQSAKLQVKDDQEGTHWLTIKNDNGQMCFTNGWKKFTKDKRIKVGNGISLYKEYDHFGSGAEFIRIEVQKA